MAMKTVTLTEEEKLLFIELLGASYCYKADRKLRRADSIRAMGEYYIDAIEKITHGDIPINRPQNNLLRWIADQLVHSGTKLYNTEACAYAIELIEEKLGE